MNGLHNPINFNGLDYYLWNAINEKVYQSRRELFKDIELLKKRIRRVCSCSINMAIGLLNAFNQESNASLTMKNGQSNSITGGNIFVLETFNMSCRYRADIVYSHSYFCFLHFICNICCVLFMNSLKIHMNRPFFSPKIKHISHAGMRYLNIRLKNRVTLSFQRQVVFFGTPGISCIINEIMTHL